MRKTLITGILVLSLGFTGSMGVTGCTTQQVKQAEADLLKVLQAADNALTTLNTPENLANAEAALSALAAVAPQTGPVHQAIVSAQAALVALQNNKGTVSAVQLALDTVVSLLETQGAVPAGAVHHAHAVAPKK
jgi:hypothetical protein